VLGPVARKELAALGPPTLARPATGHRGIGRPGRGHAGPHPVKAGADLQDGIPEPIDADLVGPYFLWKLLIDVDEQGNGYGAATIDAVVAHLRTRPGAETLFTSCADGPGSPRCFYLGYGFADTGRVMWGENVLALELADR
jgi:hypothetical protein